MEKKKSIRVTLITLVIYGVLVATHLGEYWPFSIYPMFSQAGNPWTRALVRDVTTVEDSELWEVTSIDDLIGDPVAMASIGVDQIDYSNFVSKTKDWSPKRVAALRTMLGEEYLRDRNWMIYKVDGKLIGNDSVSVHATPWLLFKRDTTLLNPNLSPEAYSK